MKKRIVSTLLLVAMLVAAVPLAAISALAADVEPQAAPREFVEADYNALYKQEGLFFSMDFFKTNRYWNPNGDTLIKFPVGPDRKSVV